MEVRYGGGLPGGGMIESGSGWDRVQEAAQSKGGVRMIREKSLSGDASEEETGSWEELGGEDLAASRV